MIQEKYDEYLTVKDSEGVLRPLVALWPAGEMQKYHQPEIDKYMKKAGKQGMSLVRIKVIEVKAKG